MGDLRCREAGVLPDGPRPVAVHGGVWTAGERVDARDLVQHLERGVRSRVQWLDLSTRGHESHLFFRALPKLYKLRGTCQHTLIPSADSLTRVSGLFPFSSFDASASHFATLQNGLTWAMLDLVQPRRRSIWPLKNLGNAARPARVQRGVRTRMKARGGKHKIQIGANKISQLTSRPLS